MLLEMIDNPLRQTQNALKIVEETSPELFKMYGGLQALNEPEETPE
jgi:hypothetical protein